MDVDEIFAERYREVEAKLRGLAAGAERERVGGGVNAGSVGTGEIRKAFGWPMLPEPLMPGPDGRTYVHPLEYYATGVPVEVRFGEEWKSAQTVCRNHNEGELVSVTVELEMWGSEWRGDIANPELIRPLAPTSLRSGLHGYDVGDRVEVLIGAEWYPAVVSSSLDPAGVLRVELSGDFRTVKVISPDEIRRKKTFSEQLDELGVDEPGAAERGFVTPLQEYAVNQRVMILWGSPNVWTAAKVEAVSEARVIVRVSSGCRERQVWIYDAREIRPVAW